GTELARSQVTVARTGDGGDESLAGYRRYRASVLVERYPALARPLSRPLSALLALMPTGGRGMDHARRFAGALSEPFARRYARWVTHLDPGLKRELTTEDFRQAAGGRDSDDLLLEAFA